MLFCEDGDEKYSLLLSKSLFAVSYLTWFWMLSQARIKKIMQADEEVGKIAMATPVLICTSLDVSFLSLSCLLDSPEWILWPKLLYPLR